MLRAFLRLHGLHRERLDSSQQRLRKVGLGTPHPRCSRQRRGQLREHAGENGDPLQADSSAQESKREYTQIPLEFSATFMRSFPIPSFSETLPLGAALTLILISGWLNRPPTPRRAASLSCVLLSFALPWLAPTDAAIARSLCAAASIVAVFRNVDIYRDPRPWTARQRLAHVVLFFDSRLLSRIPAQFAAGTWLRAASFGSAAAVAAATLAASSDPTSTTTPHLYWPACLLFAYASADALASLVHAVAALAGFKLPTLHHAPLFSRSLAEFWGRRWNLCVHRMLHQHCFQPLARHRGPLYGAVAAFAASSLLHFWLFLPGLGFNPALSAASFFLVQGAFVLAERKLQAHHWPTAARRLWTLACLMAPSALIVTPIVSVVFG